MNNKEDEFKKVTDIEEKFETFLKRYYWEQITKLANEYPEKRSLSIAFSDIDRFDSTLANLLLKEPDMVLEVATEVLRTMDLSSGVTLDTANIRVVQLPRKNKIKDIRHEDINGLISVEGLVLKITEVRPKVVEAIFECSFCQHQFMILQRGRSFITPSECPQEDGGCGRQLQRVRFLKDQSKYTNAQTIRLQDPPEELRGGELPQMVNINFEDDITGIVTPGNRINVVCIVRSLQKVTQFGKTSFFEIYLDAISIEREEEGFEELKITEEDEKAIRELSQKSDIFERLTNSIAPSIYGLEKVKEAMVLHLFGGVRKDLPDGNKLRGDIHVLLVGDPGGAKTQLLVYNSRIAPRGLYTDGGGSSAAGLTAAAVRDSDFGGGRWSLEAGALVLADRGNISIDEMDKMREEDREKMHTAMEQQIVQIDKAGLHMKLNARTAVLSAANPKYGRFDKYTALSEQINLPPTLLSRFDLIFILMDKPDEVEDRELTKHILDLHQACETERKEDLISFEPEIMPDLYRKYISFARKIRPVLSEEAIEIFTEFYIKLRKNSYEDVDAPISVTARQLEGLIRLGEAKARTQLSDTITVQDAKYVIDLVVYSLRLAFTDPETGKIDADWGTIGTTKTKRDRARVIREIIKDLEKEYGDEVPVSGILDLAEEEGMEREKAEEIIDIMKRDGILSSPGGGVVRHVE